MKENVPMLGVSNHNLAEIKQANEILKSHGLKLSAVQNHYSLINRSSEASGILKYCRENGIVFFSYMVLEQGALSGKYDTAHPMPEGSARAQAYGPILDKLFCTFLHVFLPFCRTSNPMLSAITRKWINL